MKFTVKVLNIFLVFVWCLVDQLPFPRFFMLTYVLWHCVTPSSLPFCFTSLILLSLGICTVTSDILIPIYATRHWRWCNSVPKHKCQHPKSAGKRLLVNRHHVLTTHAVCAIVQSFGFHGSKDLYCSVLSFNFRRSDWWDRKMLPPSSVLTVTLEPSYHTACCCNPEALLSCFSNFLQFFLHACEKVTAMKVKCYEFFSGLKMMMK